MDTQVKSVRCSSLPELWRCGASAQPCKVEIDRVHDLSALGTAVHACLERHITGRDVSLRQAAVDAGLEDDRELGWLVGIGIKLWQRRLAAVFPVPGAEVEICDTIAPGLQLTGHIDLQALVVAEVRNGDWKTGRLARDYRQQANGYNCLSLRAWPDALRASTSLLWVRDEDVQTYGMDHEQCRAWEEELVERALHWDGVHRSGPHCGFCRRLHECPAAIAELQREVAIIGGDDVARLLQDGLNDLEPQQIIELRRQAKAVRDRADLLDAAIRVHVIGAGRIEGEDVDLVATPVQRKRIKPREALQVLQDELGDDLAEAIKISRSHLNDLVAHRVPKGQGAKAVRALEAKLIEAGALVTEDAGYHVTERPKEETK